MDFLFDLDQEIGRNVVISHTLAELARIVNGAVVGDESLSINGIRPLEEATGEHLSFYHNRRYLDIARQSSAGAILVANARPFEGRSLLVAREPYLALACLIELFHPPLLPAVGVHPTAVVADSASIGPGVSVGPHVVIGEKAVIDKGCVISAGAYVGDDCEIGEGTWLHPHVVIEAGCKVGSRCILHAGAVVGSDGFGFATTGGVHRKVPQVGIVVIEDDVELGANTCIDRATLGETRICQGTKIDNMVQIAHNVTVGAHCLLAAQTGIAGSTKIGHHAVFAGHSGAIGHLHIAEGTIVTGKSAVTQDTEPGSMVSGFPSRPHRDWLKAQANLYRFEDLRRRIDALERALAESGSRK